MATHDLLTLYVPALADMPYRQRLLSDPETMAYNRGYDLAFDGYHPDTGCIDFPEANWEDWYAAWVGRAPERFYAYARHTSLGFVGEVDLRGTELGAYEMGVVIEAKYRGRGFGKAALSLLMDVAFEQLSAREVRNDFEEERHAALQAHRDCGFEITDRQGSLLRLTLTRDAWEAHRTPR